jgi:hypothetical protein
MQLLHILQLLVLMTLANGAPIVAKKIFGPRFSFPLDAGTVFLMGGRCLAIENDPRYFDFSPHHDSKRPTYRPGSDDRCKRSGRGYGGRFVLQFREAPPKLSAEQPGTRVRSGSRIPISDAGMPRRTFIDDRRHSAWRRDLFYWRTNSVSFSIPGPLARRTILARR